MSEICSNCGKDVPQKAGKRQKLYCDDACRMKLKRRASHKIAITNTNNEQSITEQRGNNEHEQGRVIHLSNKEYKEQIRQDKESELSPVLTIENYGQPDCQCQHCKTRRINKSKNIINHGAWLNSEQLKEQGFALNRVSMPDDAAVGVT